MVNFHWTNSLCRPCPPARALIENEKGIGGGGLPSISPSSVRHVFEALASLFIVDRGKKRKEREEEEEMRVVTVVAGSECLVNSNWPPPPPLWRCGGVSASISSHAKHDMGPRLIERTDFIPD